MGFAHPATMTLLFAKKSSVFLRGTALPSLQMGLIVGVTSRNGPGTFLPFQNVNLTLSTQIQKTVGGLSPFGGVSK